MSFLCFHVLSVIKNLWLSVRKCCLHVSLFLSFLLLLLLLFTVSNFRFEGCRRLWLRRLNCVVVRVCVCVSRALGLGLGCFRAISLVSPAWRLWCRIRSCSVAEVSHYAVYGFGEPFLKPKAASARLFFRSRAWSVAQAARRASFYWLIPFIGIRPEGRSLPFPKGPSTQLSYTLKTSNLHNYYPKPKYLIIGSFGPLGFQRSRPGNNQEPIGYGGFKV